MGEAAESCQQEHHPRSASILIVERQQAGTPRLQRMLRDLGYIVVGDTCEPDEACQRVAQEHPDLVLMDLQAIGDTVDLDQASRIRRVFGIPVIFLTDYTPERITQVIKSVEPFECIFKPVRRRELHANIERARHRHHQETQREENEQRFRTLFENSPISIWEEDFSAVKQRITALSEDGVEDFDTYLTRHPEEVAHLASLVKILDVNETSVTFFAAESKAEIATNLPSYFTNTSMEVFKDEMVALANGASTFECEIPIVTAAGESLFLLLNLVVVSGHEETLKRVLVSFIDITQRRRAEDRLRKALRQKDILLQEINHRVKNNFAMVAGLLEHQSAYVGDDHARNILEDIRHRIHTIAHIHEQLYQLPDLAEIDFAAYIRAVTNDLLAAYQSDTSTPVELSLAIDDVYMEIGQAVPCGLMVNELLSNAFEHAFAPMAERSPGFVGKIAVTFRRTDEGQSRLTVSDNGIGLPTDFPTSDEESLGTFLIDAFVKQLQGSIAWKGDNGATCEITFNEAI